MEKLTIYFDNFDNSAFEKENLETARILRDIADSIEAGNIPTKIRDINGNTVGHIEIE